jgi:hypothetical protein
MHRMRIEGAESCASKSGATPGGGGPRGVVARSRPGGNAELIFASGCRSVGRSVGRRGTKGEVRRGEESMSNGFTEIEEKEREREREIARRCTAVGSMVKMTTMEDVIGVKDRSGGFLG